MNWLSEQWLSPANYNFWSSAWGEGVKDIVELAIVTILVRWLARAVERRVHARLECHVDGCANRGHMVHGTGYRACHEHDPTVVHRPGEAVTAEHIARAHQLHLRRENGEFE